MKIIGKRSRHGHSSENNLILDNISLCGTFIFAGSRHGHSSLKMLLKIVQKRWFIISFSYLCYQKIFS
jgi:hypothetical protein